MRPSCLVLVTLLIAAPSLAQDKPLEGDLAQVQGTWTAKIGPNKDLPVTLKIKGNAMIVTFTTEPGAAHTVQAELKLDEAATPKAMDWVQVTLDGQEASNILAIYEIRGDLLKLRTRRGQGDPRPSEFLPDPGEGLDQAVFTRQDDEANQGAR